MHAILTQATAGFPFKRMFFLFPDDHLIEWQETERNAVKVDLAEEQRVGHII